MTTERLAKAVEVKYVLKLASTKLDEAKKEIKLAYQLHVSETAKEPVISKVSKEFNEPETTKLVEIMEDLVKNINDYDAPTLFTQVNEVLKIISEYKKDPEKKVRNFIHDAIRIKRQSDIQYREHIKSKYETALTRIFGLLEKAAIKLKTLVPEGSLAGGLIEPQRKELSKDKIQRFLITPEAQAMGLTTLDIVTKVLEYPELRQKLTTVINAIDRGHRPADAPELSREVEYLAQLIRQRLSDNDSYFEHGAEPETEVSEDELAKIKELKEKSKLRKEEAARLERERMQPLIQQRDDAHAQRIIEEDRQRLIRSDGVLKFLDKLLLKGTYENS
jgi:vacuolar-type H+-ATPase subunit F/Vma7